MLLVIQVLLHREEDTKNVRRLDQLANCADELCALVEMDAMFLPFCVRVPCWRIVVPRTTV